MFQYRHVKTSTREFLEARENNRVILKLDKTFSVNSIVALIQTNDVLTAFSIEDGHRFSPTEYSTVAEHIRKCAAQLPGGRLVLLGQFWIALSGINVAIANITLGAMGEDGFRFSNVGLKKINAAGLKVNSLERVLSKPLYEEIERWKTSNLNTATTS